MARNEVLEKLNMFLSKHNPFTEEAHVVYFMVQIRKILEHDGDHWRDGDFTMLRFYCDWTVHTKKTGITKNIKNIMDAVFTDVKNQIENPAITESMSPIMRFSYMKHLRVEVLEFLQKNDINSSITEDTTWLYFVGLLVKVLENQPINNPNENISLFTFIPSADRCVSGIVKFTDSVNGYDHYKFSNAY